MIFFNVKSSETVMTLVQKLAKSYTLGVETVPLSDSVGRITAEEIYATDDLPLFNRSTVDGYAVKSLNCHGVSETIPAIFSLKGRVKMGEECLLTINDQETVYVPTGGFLPQGSDAVVMIEDSELFDDTTVALGRPVADGDNIILKGSDIKDGERLFPKNHRLSSVDIGVLSSMGICKVKVLKKPVVTIISTGDEIKDITEPKKSGEIYDINGYVLNSMLLEDQIVIGGRMIVRDDYDELFDTVNDSLESSDIVLISGGSSVGTRDFTNAVIDNLPDSKKLTQGISIKPGKPTIMATSREKLIVGLPGHPVSSIIVYKVFVENYIRGIQGQSVKREQFSGVLSENLHSAPGKTTYQMVTLSGDISALEVKPLYGKSGMITLLKSAHGYIEIPDFREGLNAGERVKGYYIG